MEVSAIIMAAMDEQAKKTALRMITYGVYVLGVEHEGSIEMATITWLTQSSFSPPQIAMGIKKAGRPFALLAKSRRFAVSILGTGQRDMASAFFKPTTVQAQSVNGFAFAKGPVLTDAPAWISGEVVSIDESGDHAVIVGKVTDAGVRQKGDALTLKEMGLSYGG